MARKDGKAKLVLTVDVGGSHVKLLASNETERRRFRSGRKLGPSEMVEGVRAATESITAALQSQARACQQVGGFLDDLSRKGADNEESAQRLHEVSHELTAQAGALREDVGRFQV